MQIMQWIQIPSKDVSDKTKLRQTTACQLTKRCALICWTKDNRDISSRYLLGHCIKDILFIFSFVCVWTLLRSWFAFCFDLILFTFHLFNEFFFFAFLPICIFCTSFLCFFSSALMTLYLWPTAIALTNVKSISKDFPCHYRCVLSKLNIYWQWFCKIWIKIWCVRDNHDRPWW